jgi:flagellar motor component MotA
MNIHNVKFVGLVAGLTTVMVGAVVMQAHSNLELSWTAMILTAAGAGAAMRIRRAKGAVATEL